MSGDDGGFDAAAYDRWFDSPWGRYAFGVEGRALRRALGDVRGALALDVGCGTGRFMDVARGAGAEVLGVDVSLPMVVRAVGRGHRALVGDGRCLPFRAGCFDAAMAVTVLEFVDAPRRLLGEVMRVTRPPGRVVLALLNRTSPWGLVSARRRRQGPWSSARLLSPRRVAAWCRPYGRVSRYGVLFAPGSFPGLARLGPALEAVGRLIPRLGAFQIVVVERR